MSERAATRRRFFYSITEVHLLHALAAALINNALAGVVRVLGVLASAPHLLRFGLAFVALAAEHLRKVFVAIALTSRHSTQNEENYPQRTWHDYKAKRDFRKQFRFVASHMPRLIAALDLPAVARRIRLHCRRGNFCAIVRTGHRRDAGEHQREIWH